MPGTYMLLKCLMNSILRECNTNIMVWKDKYNMDGLLSGKLLLKVIIRDVHLDKNTKISKIHTKLSSLNTHILSIGGDITYFNTYMKVLV